MSFIDTALGISTMVATTAAAGTSVWGTVKGLDIAEEQAELQQDLARERQAMESELAAAQRRLVEIQGEGMEAQQEIDEEIRRAQLDLVRAQTDLEKAKIGLEIEKLEGAKRSITEGGGFVRSALSSDDSLSRWLMPAVLVGGGIGVLFLVWRN